jgi:DNA-directed RNA polymerase, mitochondrial
MSQAELEKEMLEAGVTRYRQKLSKAREKGVETATEPGRHLLRESVARLAEVINIWVTDTHAHTRPAAKILKQLDPDVAAMIIAKGVLDDICLRRTMISAADHIGICIEDEINFCRFKAEHPIKFSRILKRHKISSPHFRRRALNGGARFHGVEVVPLHKKERVRVGLASIELMRQATLGMTGATEGLIAIVQQTSNRGRKQSVIAPTRATEEWLRTAHEKHEVLMPFWLPTIAPPLDHFTMRGGGYHTNQIMRKPLVKTGKKQYLDELDATPMPVFYSAVNALQRTKWQVNQDVLRVLEHLWEEGIELADLPPQMDLPKPPPIEGMSEDKELLTQWKRLAAANYKRNLRLKSKRVQVARLLYMAQKFEFLPFYYPYSADFRSRLYCVPYFLQPQGDAKARSLLRFWDPKPIETQEQADIFAVSGANHFGVDKCSYAERIQWVKDNEENIKAVFQDPIDCRWWTEAKGSAWEFLAWCLEYAVFLDEGFGFQSHLPVHVDGVNNGLQCYAMALRHTPTAEAVSVSPGPTPADIYQRVADLVTDKLTRSSHPHAKGWLQFCNGSVPRECSKKPCMTLCYGSTMYSCQQSITAWYDELRLGGQPTPFSLETYDHCTYLARLMWEAIGETVTAAKAAMDWLTSVADICSAHEVPVRWTTPVVGFPVFQRYSKWTTKRIKSSVGEIVRKHVYREDQEAINGRRVRQATPANLVHSWDAAALQLTVHRAAEAGITSFSCIHDSYGVHAACVPLLKRILREAWIDIFTEDPLRNFKKEIEARLPAGVVLPDPPPTGDFDIQTVSSSEYFFH